MKKYLSSLVGALPVLAIMSAVQARPPEGNKQDGLEGAVRSWRTANQVVVDPVPVPIETTGFEAADGFDLDFQICGASFAGCVQPVPSLACNVGTPLGATENCCSNWPNPVNGWFVSGASSSCKEPSIRNVHPSLLKDPSSTQHMRFQADDSPVAVHRAFSPFNNLGVTGPTTMKWDLSATETGGSEMLFGWLGGGTNGPAFQGFMYWYNGSSPGQGYIYAYNPDTATQDFIGCWAGNACGPDVPLNTYSQYTIEIDPCRGADYVKYYKDGVLLLQHTASAMGAAEVDRFTFQGFANSGTAKWDVDNMSIVRGQTCPVVCGDGFVDAPETCEPGVLPGCNPGHSCIPAGEPGQCTCTRICTLADPCILENGDNGPYYGPMDALYGGIFLYVADTPYVSISGCGSTYDTIFFYWGGLGPNDPGSSNDDCCDPADPNCGSFGDGSDPSAACYGVQGMSPPYPPCTCYGNIDPLDNLYLAQIRAPGGTNTVSLQINKKTACAEPIPGGACCDGNTGLCVDGAAVNEADCLASSDQATFHDNKSCDIIECIRHTGACCDNNPKATHCTDGTYPEDCDGPNQIWNKGGTCATAQCPALTLGACCNTLAGTCTDNETVTSCGDTGQPGDQRVFTLDTTCANTPCDAVLGACCDTDPFGGCSDTTYADCQGDKLVWSKLQSCSQIECRHNAIPTVSTWGLAILTLLLLTGAKIYFGRRQAAAA